MKNWNTLEADENLILNTHYTPGRSGGSVKYVVVHHNAGNLTAQQIYNVWQTREASAHYQVAADGKISQHVWDSDTAWACGNWDANTNSISVEHADINTSPWTVSDATLDNGAHLVAALCKYYGLGRPQWNVNVFPHSHFSGTQCPASIAGSQNAAYMAKAQYWYDKMSGANPSAPSTPSQPQQHATDLNALADAVIRGDYGNGDQRRNALGANYDAVMAIVNQRYGITGGNGGNAGTNIDDLARRAINGEFGNGDQRRAALGSNYDAVQARVNQMLGQGGGSAPSVDLNALADAVIRGDYGNGDQRRNALGANYDAVMAIVNKKLGY
ncbi:N-acetylmuramoyl-L-alanine amidase [Bifidobacterium pseudocatenulatum]|uniref:N-acetylmuramoyl-L-alanine amidase n=1 Tax=Bifidobacterium pseudocatenulatum TaxID=28026 RepID=UPI003B9D5582